VLPVGVTVPPQLPLAVLPDAGNVQEGACQQGTARRRDQKVGSSIP
jgi:hypothetical protein